jgi:hypothetical protein
MKSLFAAATFILVLASCTPKSTPVTEAPKSATSTAEQIAQGKTIYETACKRCHKLYEPTEFTSVEWVGILNAMAPKAKLTDEQHQWVYDYVVSVKK